MPHSSTLLAMNVLQKIYQKWLLMYKILPLSSNFVAHWDYILCSITHSKEHLKLRSLELRICFRLKNQTSSMFWKVSLFIHYFTCLSMVQISILPSSLSFQEPRCYQLNHVKENIASCVYQSSASLHVCRNLQKNEFINCPLKKKKLLIPYHFPISPQSFNSSEPHLLNMDILFIEISYFYWWPKQCL